MRAQWPAVVMATTVLVLGAARVGPAAAAAKGGKSPVVARAGKAIVTVADVEAEARGTGMMHMSASESPELARVRALNRAIDNALVAEEARASGLLASEEFRLREMPPLDEFLAERLLAKVVAAVTVSAADVDKASPPTWDLIFPALYLFETEAGAAEGRRQLVAGGLIDAPRKDLGATEWGRSNFENETERALFALKKGEVSQPLLTGIGWVVGVILERTPPGAEEVAARRTAVENLLLMTRREQVREGFVRTKRREHGFRIDVTTFMDRIAAAQGRLSDVDDVEIGRFDDRIVRFRELRLYAEEARLRNPNAQFVYPALAERLVGNAFLAHLARREKLDAEPEYEALKRENRHELLVRLTRAKIAAGVRPPTEGELRAEYDSRPGLRRVPEEALVRYLWTDDRGRAEEAARRARQGGDFGALIKEYSRDPGSQAGGSPMTVRRGDVTIGFEEAVFSKKAGEVTGVVEAAGNFFVIEVKEQRAARALPFEEIRERLAESMRKDRLKAATEDYLKKLRSAVKVTIDEEALKKVSIGRRSGGGGRSH